MRTVFASLALASLLVLPASQPAHGQFFARQPTAVQVGVSALPGAGVQAVYLQPRTIFILEGAFYADAQDLFGGDDERRFQAAGAVGGAVRFLQIARVVTGAAPLEGDIDVGLRAGPGLRFKAEETQADANQRFRLLLDPFARYVHRIGGTRFFGEVGLARPHLRAGVWLGL